jgi:hypothetical protein
LGCSNRVVLGLAVLTVACFAHIRVRIEFFPVAMFSLAFLVVAVLDRVRAVRRARRERGNPS